MPKDLKIINKALMYLEMVYKLNGIISEINNCAQQTVAKMRVSEGFRAVRPASGFVSGDTDAAPQSRTAGMASNVGCNLKKCLILK